MKLLLLSLLFIVSAVSAQTTTTTTTTTVTTAPIEQEQAVFVQPSAPVPDRITVTESLRIASYWNHNGSTMGLLVNGNQRILIYVRLRKGLEGLVEPGTVLFAGESESGRYIGRARRFSEAYRQSSMTLMGQFSTAGIKLC
jgi:hypothetical protein